MLQVHLKLSCIIIFIIIEKYRFYCLKGSLLTHPFLFSSCAYVIFALFWDRNYFINFHKLSSLFSKPQHADEFASKLMFDCCKYLPEDRPSFSEICAVIKRELETNSSTLLSKYETELRKTLDQPQNCEENVTKTITFNVSLITRSSRLFNIITL